MMTDSIRPHRSRKVVDYSSFGGEDGASDDDFDVPTPPLKRSKIDKKAKTNSSQPQTTKPRKEKREKEQNKEPPKKRDRVSLEKLEEQSFERELQRVMELSKHESQEDEEVAVVHNQVENKLETDVENQPPVASSKSSSPSALHPQLNQNCVTTLEAGIEVLEDVREGAGSRSRRASAPKKSFAVDQHASDDSDDDFHVGDVDNGSDGDFSDDGDESDYEMPQPKKKTVKDTSKGKPSAKKTKATSGKASINSKVSPLGNTTPSSRVPMASVTTKTTAAIPVTTRTIGRGFTPPAAGGASKCSKNTNKEISRKPNTTKEIVRKPVLSSPGGENPLGGVKLVSPNQPRRLAK